jgi:hypothetical protein
MSSERAETYLWLLARKSSAEPRRGARMDLRELARR